MTHNARLLSCTCPLIDLALALCFAFVSPELTNAVAPLFGWAIVENFSIIETAPFLAGAAIAAVPIVLRLTGFYLRGNLQRVSTAMRQIFTFAVYYLCAFALYQSTRNREGYVYMNHVILVNVVAIPVLIFLRFLLLRWLQLNTARGRNHLRQVLLAGTAEAIANGWEALPHFWKRSLHVAGKAVTNETGQQEIQGIIEKTHVGQLILFGGLETYKDNAATITLCELQGIDVYVYLRDDHPVNLRAEVNEIGDSRLLILSSTPVYSWSRLFKSFMDRLLALIVLLCSSPLWLVAAIGIKLSDPKGPIFYRQMRSGLYGKPFSMWKFRSMYTDAEQKLDEIKAQFGNEMDGPIFKLTNDPRIFPFGHFIRKTSIDELPQLLNVLTGDMSLVGPRPLPVYETAEFPEVSARRRLSVKPGLTCYWQIEDRSDTSEFCTMVNKDLKYIDNWSIWLDVVLLLRTVPAVLFGKGAK